MDLESRSHEWKVKTFRKPTYCAFCGDFLWGFRHQGVECTTCDMPLDKKCHGLHGEEVTYPCEGKWKSGKNRTIHNTPIPGAEGSEPQKSSSFSLRSLSISSSSTAPLPQLSPEDFQDVEEDEIDPNSEDLRFSVFVPEVKEVLDSMESKKKKKKKKKKQQRVLRLGNLQSVRDQLVFLRNKEDQLDKPDKEQRKETLSLLIQRIDELAEKYKDVEYADEHAKETSIPPEVIEAEVGAALAELNSPAPPSEAPEMKYEEDDSVEKLSCLICWEDYPVHSMKSLGCGHLYCQECLVGHLGEFIRNGRVRELHCPEPDCDFKVTPEIVKAIVDLNLYRKYVDFSALQDLRENPNTRYCPVKECSMALICDPSKRKVICPACKYEYCFNCRRAYHEDTECPPILEGDSDDPDAAFHQYLKNKESKTKPCPNCTMQSEKVEGCNHMHCASCQAEWCWLCTERIYGGSALPEHYRAGPCEGLQFVIADSIEEARENQRAREEWIRNHKFRYYAPKIVRGILLAPLVIVGGVLLIAVAGIVVVLSIPLSILFN